MTNGRGRGPADRACSSWVNAAPNSPRGPRQQDPDQPDPDDALVLMFLTRSGQHCLDDSLGSYP